MAADGTGGVMDMKRCSKCGEEYPATNAYFYRNKHRKDGLEYACIQCDKARHAQWRADNRKIQRERVQIYREKNLKKVKEREARYRDQNRELINERKRSYYAENRELILGRIREYRKQKHEEITARRRDNYAQNKNGVRDKALMRALKRKRRERNLPNTISEVDVQQAHDYFDGRCAVCGRPQGLWHTIALDHWIPVSYTGNDNPGTVPGNMVPMCHAIKGGAGGCNNSKHNTMPDVWMERKFGKRKARKIAARIAEYFAWVANQPSLHED